MTLQGFQGRYDTFSSVETDIIEAKLAEAAAQLNAAAWGTSYDLAHGLLTAALLWDSPLGATMRLEEPNAKNPFRDNLNRLQKAVIPSMLVT